MANKTDPAAASIHGTDPQFLIDKILRMKIYDVRQTQTQTHDTPTRSERHISSAQSTPIACVMYPHDVSYVR